MGRGINLVILIFCFTKFYFAQNYSSHLFNKNQGLRDLFVYSISQDRAGFLCIANSKGISTFDGQLFFPLEFEKINDEIIYSSSVDSSGALWFGSSIGNLYSLKAKVEKLVPFAVGCKASINKILSSRFSNKLYLNTVGKGVFVRQKRSLEEIKGSDALNVNDLCELNSTTLLLATDEGFFAVNIKKNNLVKVANVNGAIKGLVRLKTKENVFLIHNANAEFFEIELAPNGSLISLRRLLGLDSLKTKEVKSMALTNNAQNLFINTTNAQLYIYKLQEQSLQTISEEDYSGIANSIFEDDEENIWIGTAGRGLYRFSKAAYTLVETSEPVYTITSHTNGLLYYGTKSGVLTQQTGKPILSNFFLEAHIPPVKVRSLNYQNENLWIGTENEGLIVINEANQKLELEFSSIQNISINSIAVKGSYVSVCTNLDGVYNYENNQLVEHFSVRNSLLHNNVYNSLLSKNGKTFYATHNTSFNYSEKNKLYEINTRSLGLVSDLNAFAENSHGEIYMATHGDGVYVLYGDTIKPFAENDHLDSKYCNGIICDAQDNLWITDQNNLYKYYSKEKVLHRVKFAQKFALIFNPNACHMNKAGDLFFGTNKGVLKFENTGVKSKLPKPYLLSVKVQDSIYPQKEKHSLPNGTYNISFSFSALCLKNSEEVRFSYLLEGRDEVWSEPNTYTSASFSKLTEGHYQFKIKAFNSEGLSSNEEVLFSFDIEKPYWKTALFWVLFVVGLVLVFVLILKIRTAKLIEAKEKLEALVDEKTKELRNEKEIVEKSNIRIEEQNKEIKDSITYAKRIQDALLAGTDLFAKSKDLFVFFQPRDIVSGDFYWLAEVGKLKIIVSADCTGHGVPGALMSMIGTTLLNKIVLEKNITQAQRVLSELDNEIKDALKQHTQDATRDGMDICLCCLDTENKKLIYSGAMRPLYLVRNHQLIEYAPSKFAIGGFGYGKSKKFEEMEIQAEENDMFYLFSDGYADQFGGEKGKKLMVKNFKKILISIAEMELPKQQENLKRVYNNWKGELDQVDDVLVIGLKIT